MQRLRRIGRLGAAAALLLSASGVGSASAFDQREIPFPILTDMGRYTASVSLVQSTYPGPSVMVSVGTPRTSRSSST